MGHDKNLRFSEYFDLKLKQSELEFLDIFAYRDIPLFLDPYGISAIGSKWSKECEEEIVSYFQFLVDSIVHGDRHTTVKLLNALHEVHEVALGYSEESTNGRGIGPIQAEQILDVFSSSEAVKSGDLRDIADCALMIPGINRDKISDITANILKRKLIAFTQEQCTKHGIELRKCAIQNTFHYSDLSFKSYFDFLPVIDGNPKILLPIESVRRDPELSKEKYYRDFVIEFLMAEHAHAGDSLAQVLKNGTCKVYVKDLKERYPLSAQFLYQFSKDHPQVLEEYKTQLKTKSARKGTLKLNTKRKVLTPTDRIRIVNSLKPGSSDASNFHKITYNNLIYILGDRVARPLKEREINEGRKRIDIVFNNANTFGFFVDLNTLHHIKCPKIIVECKNYNADISNPEFDQLHGRFSPKRGKFGILVCRSVQNKKALLRRCKDIMLEEKGYIIVLTDSDIAKLLKFKGSAQENLIDEFFSEKLDELIM